MHIDMRKQNLKAPISSILQLCCTLPFVGSGSFKHLVVQAESDSQKILYQMEE